MTLPLPIRFKGAPGSPYTRKMLALLRYRHIPYAFLIGDQAQGQDLPQPKVNLLPTFYLPNDQNELEAVVDSTPLIRRFEAAVSARSVIPPDPVAAFLNYLVEDYGDEWLTKPMFHYRWHYQADIEMAARILPRWRGLQTPDDELKAMSQTISERQISRLYVVGSNETTAPVIEDSYQRFLKILDQLVEVQGFLFGQRPSSADFAIYGQLTQLAKFDPTPSELCLKTAPRVYAWTDVVDDLSGNPAAEQDWLDRAVLLGNLAPLLSEIGRTYVPVMLANAKAVANAEKQFETEVDGQPWVQPTFPYQARCLNWIHEEFSRLEKADQAVVAEDLSTHGCEALIQSVAEA